MKWLKSKKVRALVAGLITVLAAPFAQKAGLPVESTVEVTALLSAYLVGQGIADFGKGATEAKR